MIITVFSFIFTVNPLLTNLHEMATARLAQAYRPATRAHLRHSIRKFLAFTVEYNINIQLLHEHDILSYIESLVIKGLKYNSILTHMSLLKNNFRTYDLPLQLLESVNIKLMLRACSLTMDFRPSVKGIFTVEILNDIIRACSILLATGPV